MCPLTAAAPACCTSTGLLLVRLVVGAAFILHGWPKIQHPTDWMGEAGSSVPGALQATGAGIEFVGGILLAVGLVTRVAALLLAAQMVAALAMVHIPHGDPFVAMGRPSAELASVYLVVSLLVATTGPGAFSLDALIFGGCRSVRSPSAAGAGH
jgi:putative oxidoreductase